VNTRPRPHPQPSTPQGQEIGTGSCAACGYDPSVPAPILDAHAIRIRDYLELAPEEASSPELSDALGIPIGTLQNRWFRARGRAFGIEPQRRGRSIVWRLA
jgi:hypothetical protein